MTHNQIAYFQAQEEARHNQATETETNRSNVARETETNRANRVTEIETGRHNRATEYETSRNNRAVLSENVRHNQATESLTQQVNAINNAHYQRQDYNQSKSIAESARHNVAQEFLNRYSNYEISRSHRANESISATLNAINARNAKIAQQNANTNWYNAETTRRNVENRFNLDLLRYPYEIAETQARTQKWINDASLSATKESVIPVQLGYEFLNSMSGVGRSVSSFK